ncbi:hypothetical protein XH96_23130 [Bradyrhizobium sp. CCBAU 51765]|nr:hypothetical protein XH96_23130 [Bradyrhizobium sp. CCBAU 51765]
MRVSGIGDRNTSGDEVSRRSPPRLPSLRAQRSNPESYGGGSLDCFAALAMTVWEPSRRINQAFAFSCARSSSTSTRTFSE